MPTPTPDGLCAEWITALRSGEYSRIAGKLRCKNGHCCLGVAGEILVKHSLASWFGNMLYDTTGTFTSPAVLPETLIGYFGLVDSSSQAITSPRNQGLLANLNDRGATFEEIADLLEGKITPEALLLKYPILPSTMDSLT